MKHPPSENLNTPPASPTGAKLAGQQVAVAGRLASMSKAEAIRLLSEHDARYTPVVTERTSLVVVGRRGLPLDEEGAVSRKLARAAKLREKNRAPEIISEEEFLQRLGLSMATGEVHRLYTAERLARLLGVSRRRLRTWVQAGLIVPEKNGNALAIEYFDFCQVAAAKTLADLARSGVRLDRVRRSLEGVRRWLGDIDQPLAQLAVLQRDGQLLVRREQGQLADAAGQIQIEFAEHGPPAFPLHAGPQSAEEWFAAGCEHEDAGRWTDAVAAYRRSLLLGGPEAETAFNLANSLYQLGRKLEAAERYRQAVEIEPKFVEAWNNLGIVLAELKECDDAVEAYRRAIELDPHYADSHYNLAECLERNGCARDARAHWQAYVRLDPASEWGVYARGRLANG